MEKYTNQESVLIMAHGYKSHYKITAPPPTGYKFLAMVDFTCDNYGSISWVNANYSNNILDILLYNHTQIDVQSGSVTAKVLFIRDI